MIIEEVDGLVLGSGVRVYTYRFQGVRLSEHSQHACFSFNFWLACPHLYTLYVA